MRDTKAPFRATPKFGPLWSYKSALHKLRVHWSQMECCTFSSSFLTSIKFLLRFLETFFCSPNLNSPPISSRFSAPLFVLADDGVWHRMGHSGKSVDDLRQSAFGKLSHSFAIMWREDRKWRKTTRRGSIH